MLPCFIGYCHFDVRGYVGILSLWLKIAYWRYVNNNNKLQGSQLQIDCFDFLLDHLYVLIKFPLFKFD